MKFLSKLVNFVYATGLFHTLYGVVMWAVLTAGAFLILKDIWSAMGVVSAYVLYGILNSIYHKEVNDTYREMVKKYVESNEAKG